MSRKKTISTEQEAEILERIGYWSQEEIDEWVETNSDSGDYGVGWGSAFIFNRAPQWASNDGGFERDSFLRRLWRLSGDHFVEHDLYDSRTVIDFTVVENPILIAKSDDFTDFRRGETGDKSAVFLKSVSDTWRICEFCLRLAPPYPLPEDRTEISHQLSDALERVGAPADNTMVWVRPLDTSIGKTPHIAGYDTSISPPVFLDWLSAFLDEWDKESRWTV